MQPHFSTHFRYPLVFPDLGSRLHTHRNPFYLIFSVFYTQYLYVSGNPIILLRYLIIYSPISCEHLLQWTIHHSCLFTIYDTTDFHLSNFHYSLYLGSDLESRLYTWSPLYSIPSVFHTYHYYLLKNVHPFTFVQNSRFTITVRFNNFHPIFICRTTLPISLSFTKSQECKNPHRSIIVESEKFIRTILRLQLTIFIYIRELLITTLYHPIIPSLF